MRPVFGLKFKPKDFREAGGWCDIFCKTGVNRSRKNPNAVSPMSPASVVSRRRHGQTGWLLFRPDLCQKDWHREYSEELCRSSQEIETAKNLTAEFYELTKNGKIEKLEDWLNRAAASGINELASFAKGINRTYRRSKRQSKYSGVTGRLKDKSIV